MLVYVTSLYSVRNEYLPTLYQHFQQLIPHIQSPMYVFAEEPLPFPVPQHVHVLLESLDTFETYRKVLHGANARLPEHRNSEKDTAAFMALMNTKVELLWRALPYAPAATHLAWIDAGILKIARDSGRTEAAFQRQQAVTWPADKVAVPGCWAPVAPSSDSICWRFCGGFLVLPTALVDEFYHAVTAVLEAWLAAGHLAWEVNIWAALEWTSWSDRFAWWAADHNERMLEPPSMA